MTYIDAALRKDGHLIEMVKAGLEKIVEIDDLSILVDYILVMVGNKKTRDQVQSDLVAFMGPENAHSYSNHLFEMLNTEYGDESVPDKPMEVLEESIQRSNSTGDADRREKPETTEDEVVRSHSAFRMKSVVTRTEKPGGNNERFAKQWMNKFMRTQTKDVPMQWRKVDDASGNRKRREREEEKEEKSAPEWSLAARLGPAKKSKVQKVKCSFWPNCSNNQCQFVHPTEQCSNWPDCSFGDTCLFIHPFCKFGAKCTRSDCTYYHDRSSSIAVTENSTKCKYGVKCFRKGCSFSHPPRICKFGEDCRYKKQGKCKNSHAILCRNGLECTLSYCTFAHPWPESDESME